MLQNAPFYVVLGGGGGGANPPRPLPPTAFSLERVGMYDIRQPMLKLKTHSGLHYLFLYSNMMYFKREHDLTVNIE
jgi:hypothetical protein